MKERTETTVDSKLNPGEKLPYTRPQIEEHEPLEESTAYVYYYYVW